MASLSDYERLALAEIVEWKAERARAGFEPFAQLARSAPARWLGRRLPELPEAALRPVFDAVTAFLTLLSDGAHWTYSDAAVLTRANNLGMVASSVEELAQQPLERLDELARGMFTQNQVLAALEGAGTGAGGLALLAADVPVMLTLAFRSIQQIGAAYGFDMRDPESTPLVIRILGAAAGAGDVATVELAKSVPRELAKSIARKKLAQWLPIAGAAVGAGFNYWFIGATSRAAYMTFRELYLERKQAARVPVLEVLPNAPGGEA